MAQVVAPFLKNKQLMAFVGPWFKEMHYRLHHPLYQYKPDNHPKRNQLAFHASEAPVRLLFGGSQSGKSRAGAQEIAWWLRGEHPYQEVPKEARIYVVSANYRNIQEGIYRHLIEILPKWEIASYGPRKTGHNFYSWITMKNGAQVDFLSAEGNEEARRVLQAAAIDLAVVDEEVEEGIWIELQRRRLSTGGRGIICATLIRSEPWCLTLEDLAEIGDPRFHLTRLSTYVAEDRGHVKRQVVKELESTLTEEQRKVTLEGYSRRREGLVYPEFTGAHVIAKDDEFDIPKEWTRYCCLDPGFNTFAVLWLAVAPDEKYVVYRELYEHGTDLESVLQKILLREGYRRVEHEGKITFQFVADETEEVEIRLIDPAAFGHHETGQLKVGNLIPAYAQQYGLGSRLSVFPARNDVDLGIELCKRSLQKGLDDIAKMRVFASCRNFISEIRKYRFKQDSPGRNRDRNDGKPVKRHDHLLDAWRYIENQGIVFKRELEAWQKPVDLDALPASFTTKTPERLKQQFRAILQRRERKEYANSPHPDGLGAEY